MAMALMTQGGRERDLGAHKPARSLYLSHPLLLLVGVACLRCWGVAGEYVRVWV